MVWCVVQKCEGRLAICSSRVWGFLHGEGAVFIRRVNKIGESTVPCGTPDEREKGVEDEPGAESRGNDQIISMSLTKKVKLMFIQFVHGFSVNIY